MATERNIEPRKQIGKHLVGDFEYPFSACALDGDYPCAIEKKDCFLRELVEQKAKGIRHLLNEDGTPSAELNTFFADTSKYLDGEDGKEDDSTVESDAALAQSINARFDAICEKAKEVVGKMVWNRDYFPLIDTVGSAWWHEGIGMWSYKNADGTFFRMGFKGETDEDVEWLQTVVENYWEKGHKNVWYASSHSKPYGTIHSGFTLERDYRGKTLLCVGVFTDTAEAIRRGSNRFHPTPFGVRLSLTDEQEESLRSTLKMHCTRPSFDCFKS